MSDLAKVVRLFPDTFAFHASGKQFKIYKHVRFMSDAILAAIRQGNGRLIVSMPPRHGKSLFISQWLPAWFLEMNPDKRVILCSYAAELASSFGRKVRNEMESNDFFTTKLSADSTAAHRFDTKRGGGMVTAGVGGPILGKGGHLVVIDDPYKNKEEAYSQKHRDKVWEWWETTLRSRFEPGATNIVVMQRWHTDDLAGRLIKEKGFTEIKLAAIAGESDPIGRAVGEALCPERYDIDALLSIQRDQGSTAWQAMYQQSPTPIEGALFKRRWWKLYREPPAFFRRVVQFWDCAQKAGISNDYSVCATWGETDAGFFLLDLWRQRVEAPQLEAAVESLYRKHLPAAVVIEDKSSGSSIIQRFRQNSTLPIIAYDPGQKDKEVRASNATPTVEAGNCFLPINAPWLEDFIAEHEKFPLVDHDDQVDTTSMMVEYFKLKPKANPRVRVV